jgi:hypothetical protein
MLIGSDYPKIEFSFGNITLLEPNAFIGDIILCLIAFIFARKIGRFHVQSSFFIYWQAFFYVFAFGFLAGGLGHLLYHYWGIPGKFASWYFGILSTTCIELAMVSVYPSEETRKPLKSLVIIQLVIALIAHSGILLFADLNLDPTKGMLIPTVHATIGLGIMLGFLGYFYHKKIDISFRYLWISSLVLVPATIIQSQKINFAQWFDRNDLSHLLLIFSLFLYYQTVKEFQDKQQLRVI